MPLSPLVLQLTEIQSLIFYTIESIILLLAVSVADDIEHYHFSAFLFFLLRLWASMLGVQERLPAAVQVITS